MPHTCRTPHHKAAVSQCMLADFGLYVDLFRCECVFVRAYIVHSEWEKQRTEINNKPLQSCNNINSSSSSSRYTRRIRNVFAFTKLNVHSLNQANLRCLMLLFFISFTPSRDGLCSYLSFFLFHVLDVFTSSFFFMRFFLMHAFADIHLWCVFQFSIHTFSFVHSHEI